MVGLITLDCWDTVLENSEAWDAELVSGFHRVLSERTPNWTADDSLNVFRQESGLFSETLMRECVTTPAVERIRVLGEIANLDLSEIQISHLCASLEEAIFHPIPKLLSGVAEFCRWAKAKNLAVGIISNTGWFSGKAIRNVLRHYDLLSKLDVITFSDEMGRAKPHKSIFDSARGTLGFEGSQCIHIGDSIKRDIEGALAAGYSAIHFHRDGICSTSSYRCVTSFQEARNVVAVFFGISPN